RLLLRDHRADERVAVLWIAGDEGLGLRDEHVPELVVDALVDADALHADAALARLVERAEHDPFERVVEVGVLVDHHRGVAAPLAHEPLFARPWLAAPTH